MVIPGGEIRRERPLRPGTRGVNFHPGRETSSGARLRTFLRVPSA